MTVREALEKAMLNGCGLRVKPWKWGVKDVSELSVCLAPKIEAALRAAALEMWERLRDDPPQHELTETLDACVTAGIEKLGEEA